MSNPTERRTIFAQLDTILDKLIRDYGRAGAARQLRDAASQGGDDMLYRLADAVQAGGAS